ncbi:hypothetical protein EDC01DRAFT_640958 [Geopyxis carbonaria]|nr:hypothetical protein EDC01DRAFT_640958 [Geopyxis carbonaria]
MNYGYVFLCRLFHCMCVVAVMRVYVCVCILWLWSSMNDGMAWCGFYLYLFLHFLDGVAFFGWMVFFGWIDGAGAAPTTRRHRSGLARMHEVHTAHITFLD